MLSVKRLFASIMLTLFLLNVLGYYGIYHGLIAKSARELSQQIGDDIDAVGGAMTFRVPLAIPYAVDSREYEAAQGQFEYEGEVYQLVKQKLVRDTLYLVGVKNERSSLWSKALTDYVMSFTDTEDDTQELSATPGFIKDFISHSVSLTSQTSGWVQCVDRPLSSVELVPTFCASVVHPPERA